MRGERVEIKPVDDVWDRDEVGKYLLELINKKYNINNISDEEIDKIIDKFLINPPKLTLKEITEVFKKLEIEQNSVREN